MFQFSEADAGASSVCVAQLSASQLPPPRPRYETVRHMLYGSRAAVQNTIYTLHHLDYAEPNDWTKPVPTGQSNEVVAVLIKRVRV